MAKKSMEEMMKKGQAQPEQPKEDGKVVEEKIADQDHEQVTEGKTVEHVQSTEATPEKHEEEVAAGTGNSAQVAELPNNKPTEAGQPPVELTDGTLEEAEDHKKTEPQAQPEQPKEEEKKIVVTYIGGGTWRDEKGCAWASEDRGERIMKTRQYKKSEYDQRKDLQFMVRYKSMTATVVE